MKPDAAARADRAILVPAWAADGRGGLPLPETWATADGQKSLPAAAKAVLAMIALAAEAGKACPSNEEIADAIGEVGPGRVAGLINRIQAVGLICVERGRDGRIVTILSSGRRTAGATRPEFTRVRVRSSQPSGRNAQRRRDRAVGPSEPRAAAVAIAKRMAPRIARDPCFFCGVRGDIGCSHGWRPA